MPTDLLPIPQLRMAEGCYVGRYILKQDNLKLNTCPLQGPPVQPHSACPELRPLWKASPWQPPYQARRIKSVSWLLSSFYKLQICTVENSGFLANDHRINTPPYKLKTNKPTNPETLLNALSHHSKVHRLRTQEPFCFKNVQLWYSFQVLWTPMTTSCKAMTITRALWEATIWLWANWVLIKPNDGNRHTLGERCVNHSTPYSKVFTRRKSNDFFIHPPPPPLSLPPLHLPRPCFSGQL